MNFVCLFPEKRLSKRIRFIRTRNNLIVFYPEKRSTRPTPLYLPKELELTKDFLVGLGIYIGEGSRNRHPKITNSEPRIINQAILFFNLFGIDLSRLKAWIQVHERSDAPLGKIKNHWVRNTDLDFKNIVSVRVKKSSGNAKIKRFGTLHLEVYSILLQMMVAELLNKVHLIVDQLSQSQKLFLLKGLFAGEGSVGIAKSGSLNEVRYTSTRYEERMFVKKILESFGVEVKDYSKWFDLRVFGFGNLKKLQHADLFEFHPERRLKFSEGFSILKDHMK